VKSLCFIYCLLVTALGAAAEPAVPWNEAVKVHQITLEANGNGRDQLTLSLHNPTAKPLAIALPAGLIAEGAATKSRVISLRAVSTEVPAKGAVDIALPVVALSSTNSARAEAYTITTDAEPRLSGLLKALADQPDAPRPTTQLAAFCLLEDITFARWRQFLGAAEAQPTPAEITQAIDALGLLRVVAPEQKFALAADSDLKLRALRNPWSRAKAMVVYGLDLGDGAVPPDIRQLLHTSVGDNCPICRQRSLLQDAPGAP
jgi:hypothetical protein